MASKCLSLLPWVEWHGWAQAAQLQKAVQPGQEAPDEAEPERRWGPLVCMVPVRLRYPLQVLCPVLLYAWKAVSQFELRISRRNPLHGCQSWRTACIWSRIELTSSEGCPLCCLTSRVTGRGLEEELVDRPATEGFHQRVHELRCVHPSHSLAA